MTAYACAACGRRVVAGITTALGGHQLGLCAHSDSDIAIAHLVPVAPVEVVEVVRARRREDATYRRAKIKSLTPEGRAKLTPREVEVMARRDAARP